MVNQFVKETTCGAGSARTWNGASSYASIGTAMLDQFAKAGSARGRAIEDVFADMGRLWAENPDYALKFPFYLRMVTRKAKMFGGNVTDAVQRGQGVRDEAFKRLLWLALYQPDVFYQNLWVLPIVGSWKDLWVLLSMSDDLQKERFFEVIAKGINDEYHRELVKKYLPRIRANGKCKTEWAKKSNALAKEFCKYVGWAPKEYRSFKSTGKAHEFQRVICGRLYDALNFNTIPGKAPLNLVSGGFLDNHNLTEKYLEWIKSQPVAKFVGYPYELAVKVEGNLWTLPLTAKITIDKQFDNLIKTAKEDGGAIKGNVWCAMDRSGSMTDRVSSDSYLMVRTVCYALGVYFSTLNEGAFHKNVVMFDNESKSLQLQGDFTDMYQQVSCAPGGMGSTNFQSVIDEMIRIRKSKPEIPVSDFPETLLVVSDMQFNKTGKYPWDQTEEDITTEEDEKTNFELAKAKLRKVFPEEFVDNFKVVWWQVNAKTTDFPSNMDCGGTYNISGFDGSIVSFLLGGETVVDPQTGEKRVATMEEIIDKALNQEVLSVLSL